MVNIIEEVSQQYTKDNLQRQFLKPKFNLVTIELDTYWCWKPLGFERNVLYA